MLVSTLPNLFLFLIFINMYKKEKNIKYNFNVLLLKFFVILNNQENQFFRILPWSSSIIGNP